MLQAFRDNKKVILSIEKERANWLQGLQAKKRQKLHYKIAPSSLPIITESNFDFLKQICPILKVFLNETLKFSHNLQGCRAIWSKKF